MSKSRTHQPSSASTANQWTFYSPRIQTFVLVLFAFVLYVQTISHTEFVADDGMAISGNAFVQQGMTGIPDLLSHDSFYGYDIQSHRQNTRKTYRPLSFITFAIEKMLFNGNLQASHCIQTLLYVGTVLLLYFTLRRLLVGYHVLLPYCAAMLFAAHPIHTEVVANLKSRDELLALLFSLAALLSLLKSLKSHASENNHLSLIAAVGLYALALLSKESALLFLPIFPLALFIFTETQPKQIFTRTAPLLAMALVYLFVWFGVFGRVEEAAYAKIVYNPYAFASFAERTATATAVLALYLAKAVFPVTLSTGYSFNEIPLMSWADWKPLGALCVVLGCLAVGLMLLRKRHILAFCILSFFATMVIASNYIIYAGSLLSERFLFAPSVFAALALAWFLLSLPQFFFRVPMLNRLTKHLTTKQGVSYVLAGLLAVYGVKTLYRNSEWKNTMTLLKADVAKSPNSIILRQMYAGILLQTAQNEPSPTEHGTMLETAHQTLLMALTIDSVSLPALYNGLGNYFSQRGRGLADVDSAEGYYRKALGMDSSKAFYRKNIAAVFITKGSLFVAQGDLDAGVKAFTQATHEDSTSEMAYSNLGAVLAMQKRYAEAIPHLQHALTLNPDLAKARNNLAICERKLRDTTGAVKPERR